jgi:hypothetical protein
VIEAVCTRDGETFNPADLTDLAHVQRKDGTECGAPGRIAWVSDDSIDPAKVYELGEAIHRCGEFSRANPTVPLTGNPHEPAIDPAQRAAFGDTDAVYFCPACRRVAPRLDPADHRRTDCCGVWFLVDWSPDDD